MNITKDLTFFDDLERKVSIIPLDISLNCSLSNYCLSVDDNEKTGEVYFDDEGQIVDCLITNKEGSTKAPVKEFKEHFYELVKNIVPKVVYKIFLHSLDEGEQGIEREADDLEALSHFDLWHLGKRYL